MFCVVFLYLIKKKKLNFSCFTAPAQVRYAHTDIQVPDFSAYRRDSVKDKRSSSDASADSRRSFTYMIVGGL